MRFIINQHSDFPTELSLPWQTRLDHWPKERLLNVPRGISRHTVCFVSHENHIYAIKELPESVAEKEYGWLRHLAEHELPAVKPVALVVQRVPPNHGEEPDALLITRFLDFALPYRTVIAGGATEERMRQLLDALADLLVQLHLAGFFWGDCSLSNTLFRLDAGRLVAYLVDAETSQQTEGLSDARRAFDLQLAHTNIGGELLDLQAAGELASDIDPAASADSLLQRYHALWQELTQDEVFSTAEQYRINERIQRLNQLGFDVEEMEVETLDDGHHLKLKVRVVEPGYHRRRLERLTGLVVEENQARRMLNDMEQFSAWYQQQKGTKKLPSAMLAYHWYNQVYLPAIQAIPDAYKQRMDEAEIFHQLLEHRWYLSERAGKDVGFDLTVKSYIESVLKPASPN